MKKEQTKVQQDISTIKGAVIIGIACAIVKGTHIWWLGLLAEVVLLFCIVIGIYTLCLLLKDRANSHAQLEEEIQNLKEQIVSLSGEKPSTDTEDTQTSSTDNQ